MLQFKTIYGIILLDKLRKMDKICPEGGITLATYNIPRNVKGERKNINDIYS